MVLTLPLLLQVHAHMPHIRLRLVEEHSGWLQEWLLAGRIDLYLVSAPHDALGHETDVVEMKAVAATALIGEYPNPRPRI
jgi:DNA-binding transcriptional LysR family regulator